MYTLSMVSSDWVRGARIVQGTVHVRGCSSLVYHLLKDAYHYVYQRMPTIYVERSTFIYILLQSRFFTGRITKNHIITKRNLVSQNFQKLNLYFFQELYEILCFFRGISCMIFRISFGIKNIIILIRQTSYKKNVLEKIEFLNFHDI